MGRMVSTVSYSFLVAAGLIMAGCGGGGEAETASDATTYGIASYVDEAVEGVSYRCGRVEGITDVEGHFRFERGKGCRLTLGDIPLRDLEAETLVDDGVVIESDPAVAALLQSLDDDGDLANGIRITPDTVQALKETGILKIPQSDGELEALIGAIREKHPEMEIKPVSFAEASGHIKETYAKYLESGQSHKLRLTDETAFNQYATGPVLYSIPVLAKAQSPERYGLPMLSDAAFDALSEEERYKVAIKLYGSLFYGVSPDRFKAAVASGSFVSDTFALFARQTTPAEIAAVEEKLGEYDHDDGYYNPYRTMGLMLARLYELPPGEAFLNRWAAYILAQTILFSPAYELDTVYNVDSVDVYASLVRDFDDGFSMQWVTFTHMMSDENWRRFRSPEDNGREMLEIYTMDFEDAHVPLAGKALQNWKLDRRSNTLVIDLNENTEPISGLFPGRIVKNGTDFYSALVLQPAFTVTVTRRLVEIYFPDYDEAAKARVTEKIVASRPMRYTDILKQIVFSEEYLLHAHKTRSFEESFFQVAKTLGWIPKRRSFASLAENLDRMHQATMRYKLGRKVEVPLDTQSFAWYHKTMRENVMLNYDKNTSWESSDDGWPFYEIFAELPSDLIEEGELDESNRRQPSWYVNERRRAAYIVNQLFVPIAGREATAEELDAIVDLIDDEKYEKDRFENMSWWDMYGNRDPANDVSERAYFAQVVLNYLSRINTVYEFEAVE